MSTRYRLGSGFTVGSSGIRYGTRIGGTYVNVGRSGTLISGGGVRHFSHGPRRGSSTTQGASEVSGGQTFAMIVTYLAINCLAGAIAGFYYMGQASAHHPGETYGFWPSFWVVGFLSSIVVGFVAACLANGFRR